MPNPLVSERTITSALKALRIRTVREGRPGLEHIEALLAIQGDNLAPVPPPMPANRFRKGELRRLILAALRWRHAKALSMALVTNMMAHVTGPEACAVKSDDEWVNLVKGMLRAEMARRAITYEHLAVRLADLGVKETPVNLRNKVARGGFSAIFFVQCLKALEVKELRFD